MRPVRHDLCEIVLLMEAGVLTAIVTATASLVVALTTAGLTYVRERSAQERAARQQVDLARLSADLDLNARREERAETARSQLDRYREPLLQACLDLAGRLDNIRNRYFLDVYFDTKSSEHRKDIALKSTLYRFARYWCVVEELNDRVALLDFNRNESTKSVANALRGIGQTLASDRYDNRDFMVWREEQRAISELMRDKQNPLNPLGFASFTDRFDQDFIPWFQDFADSLQPDRARRSERLRTLQGQLADLAHQLDEAGTSERQWQSLAKGAQTEAQN